MRIHRSALSVLLMLSGCGAATIVGQDAGAGGKDAGATGGGAGAHPTGGAAGGTATDGGAAATGGAGGSAATGGAGGSAGTGGAGGCAAETDPQFCARLGKSCEQFSGTDSCGAPRNANCGSCATGMGCVINVCQTPVCTSFVYQPSAFASFSVAGAEEVIIAASASGQSIAYARAPAGAAACEMFTVYLADETAPDSGTYTSRDITSWITTNNLFRATGELGALSGDGLTFIGFSADQTKIESAKRSALQLIDFGTPSTADFVTINGFVAGTPGKFRAPTISADGLELYYTINGINTAADGIYHSVRASTGVPFPAGARDTALTPDYEYVSGISSDRLTIFLFKGFGGVAFTRLSTSADWSNPYAPAAPPQIGEWDHKPFQDCRTLVATGSAVGGCNNQDIYFLYRQ
jgi:hypothetical protein